MQGAHFVKAHGLDRRLTHVLKDAEFSWKLAAVSRVVVLFGSWAVRVALEPEQCHLVVGVWRRGGRGERRFGGWLVCVFLLGCFT